MQLLWRIALHKMMQIACIAGIFRVHFQGSQYKNHRMMGLTKTVWGSLFSRGALEPPFLYATICLPAAALNIEPR
jgi:hypothetical protein